MANKACMRCPNKYYAKGLCRLCYMRDYAARVYNGEKRRRRLVIEYGMTRGEFETRLAEQGGKCAICGWIPKPVRGDGRRQRLNIDHSHKSSLVRGLLCWKCNKGLGWFSDKRELLANAARYLQERDW